MVFNSFTFFVFLPIVFAVYWCFNKNLRWQNLFIVAASYAFYGWWDWRFLILIAFTTLCSWASGVLMVKISNKRVAGENDDNKKLIRKRKWITAANIIINLFVLCVFKYYDFFVVEFCNLFGCSSNGILINAMLPVGISFYTFQALSYSIDVYRDKINPTRDIVAFFAYVSFFPQLVAGPIERATNLLPQFEKSRYFDYSESVEGCRRILWGLFKKMVIADNCAVYVDSVWSNFHVQSGSTLALAAVLFALQIYGDFSGYSDIAIGTARLFGIRLRDNFLTPYFSRNVAEFWKRWHISLNTWFVDYVYIPLGGSRHGILRTILNTFVIFILSGLWHGANWTFLGWGFYHALLFVPLVLIGTNKKYKVQDKPLLKQFPSMLLTFVLVTLGWILFRATSITEAMRYVAYVFDGSLFSVPWLMSRKFWAPLFVSIVVMFVFEWLGRGGGYGLSFMRGRPRLLQAFVYYVVIAMIFVWHSTEGIQFIYFQF